MKFRIALLLALLCNPGIGVSSATTTLEDPYDVKLVKSWVELDPSILEGDSFLEKAIFRRGDRVALAIAYGFRPKQLVEPARVERILSIIRLSFSQPSYITRDQDRDPAVTMLLLSFLKQECNEKELEQQIVNTELYVFSPGIPRERPFPVSRATTKDTPQMTRPACTRGNCD